MFTLSLVWLGRGKVGHIIGSGYALWGVGDEPFENMVGQTVKFYRNRAPEGKL